MLKGPSRRYLYCQSVGWGMFLMIYIASGLLFTHLGTIKTLEYALVTFLAGIFITHLLRLAILRYGWLNGPTRQGLPWLFLATVLAAMAAGRPWISRVLLSGIEYFLPFLPWTIMYCLYYQIQKTRRKNAEIRRLELLLKEKSATAGNNTVDIESITRSLDRIRSLIDVDKTSARAEITAFSQLLRQGSLKVNDPQ